MSRKEEVALREAYKRGWQEQQDAFNNGNFLDPIEVKYPTGPPKPGSVREMVAIPLELKDATLEGHWKLYHRMLKKAKSLRYNQFDRDDPGYHADAGDYTR